MPATDPVKVGDHLIVEDPAPRRNVPRGTYEVVVTKAARVWLEMAEVEPGKYPRAWRMRRDTQDSGDRVYSQSNSRFYTLEQFAERQQDRVCAAVLRDHWVEISHKSRHYGDKQFQRELASWLMARERAVKSD